MKIVRAVMGAGPRTGTTWVMKQLADKGLPVYWTRNYMDSYYETHPEDFGSLENVIVKIWPVSIQSINIERAVLLERDFESQMQSMKEQYSKEILNGSVIDYSVDQLYEACIAALDMITFPVLRVNTEDLDDEIGNIVDWMEYKRWH